MKISTRNARRIREGIYFGIDWHYAHGEAGSPWLVRRLHPDNALGALAAERTVITLGRRARLAKQKEHA